jgi:uncharacterized protein with PQ loop repeat
MLLTLHRLGMTTVFIVLTACAVWLIYAIVTIYGWIGYGGIVVMDMDT